MNPVSAMPVSWIDTALVVYRSVCAFKPTDADMHTTLCFFPVSRVPAVPDSNR